MRKIALCMELSDRYEHGIARGVARYAKSKPDWRLYGYGWMFRSIDDLEHWKGDGILARVESAETADRLARLGLPIVDVAGAYTRSGFRTVANDDLLTGYKAALHLRSCGFERFAFLGVSGTLWSAARKEGFRRGIGSPKALPSFERSLPWWEGRRSGALREEGGTLGAFLSSLEPPVGLFACNDTTGLRATELARELGIGVPESLAVLGVDDEDIVCELASPSLSSLRLDCEGIGYRVAAVLDAALSSRKPRAGARVAIAPGEVAERESTRVFVCPDDLVSRAATFIRGHAHEGIGVPEVLAVVPASRRTLELRFRKALGRSVHEEIVRVRITRAKRLLRATDMTVARVAEESGFGAIQRFHAAFRDSEGVPPGRWRGRERAAGAR